MIGYYDFKEPSCLLQVCSKVVNTYSSYWGRKIEKEEACMDLEAYLDT